LLSPFSACSIAEKGGKKGTSFCLVLFLLSNVMAVVNTDK